MSTLNVPPLLTSPKDDAIQLHRAFKGLGCETSVVINVLAHRDATQRWLIQKEYREMYSEELLKRLSSELRGKLESAILLWMHDLPGRDAIIIRNALMSEPPKLEAAMEVLCFRTQSQIQILKQHYREKFGIHFEEVIEARTSGDNKNLLLAYMSTPRYDGPGFDMHLAENDAKLLYKAGEKKLGTDEKTFIHIFSERSGPQLAAVSAAYHNIYGSSLKKVIKHETSGTFRNALLTILQCSENHVKHFAKLLHRAMKGLGTDDTTLIRVIVTRAEIDMLFIKAEYIKKYNKTLNDEVHSETSGHYRDFLLALLGPNC